jgi:hypothetical protein
MNKNAFGALFTKESLAGLQGAAAATLLVPNVLTYLIGNDFQPYEKWLGFAIAMVLSAMVALQAPKKGWTKWVAAILNGFLVYASAVGLNSAMSPPVMRGLAQGARPTFFHSWYP